LIKLKPLVQLYGKASETAKKLSLNEICISFSDTNQYGVAATIGAQEPSSTA